MCFDELIVPHIHVEYIYHTSIQTFCFICSTVATESLITAHLFTISVVLPFPNHTKNGNIDCIICYWLLSNIHLILIYVLRFITIFLMLKSVAWIYHQLLTHLLEGHLGCFQILKIKNKTSINISQMAELDGCKWSRNLGKFLGTQLLDHVIWLC